MTNKFTVDKKWVAEAAEGMGQLMGMVQAARGAVESYAAAL